MTEMAMTTLEQPDSTNARKELGRYSDWYPSNTYAKLRQYRLIIFDWNAIFSSTHTILPGVRDTLYTLKKFFCRRGGDPIEICLIRDCESDATNRSAKTLLQKTVRIQPTKEEWTALKPLMYDEESNTEGIFEPNDICFAISSKSRKPSPICLEHFMSEWIGIRALIENGDGSNNHEVWPFKKYNFLFVLSVI